MKAFIFIYIFGFSILHGQLPMIIEGNGELARLSISGSSTDIGYLSFRPSSSVLQGYFGVWYNDPSDVDFGTFKRLTKIHLSTKLQNRLSIYPDGSVYIPALAGTSTRKVYTTMFGKLEAPSQDYICNIQHSEFRANDADGEHVEIVKSNTGIEFVQHQGDLGDDGVLVAAINLQSNIKIKSMTVVYINRATDNEAGNKFEACLQYGKKIHDSFNVTLDRTEWTHLPKGGAIVPSPSERFQVESLDVDFPDIITSDDRMYSILIRCEDCNLQYIRAAKLQYTYN